MDCYVTSVKGLLLASYRSWNFAKLLILNPSHFNRDEVCEISRLSLFGIPPQAFDWSCGPPFDAGSSTAAYVVGIRHNAKYALQLVNPPAKNLTRALGSPLTMIDYPVESRGTRVPTLVLPVCLCWRSKFDYLCLLWTPGSIHVFCHELEMDVLSTTCTTSYQNVRQPQDIQQCGVWPELLSFSPVLYLIKFYKKKNQARVSQKSRGNKTHKNIENSFSGTKRGKKLAFSLKYHQSYIAVRWMDLTWRWQFSERTVLRLVVRWWT